MENKKCGANLVVMYFKQNQKCFCYTCNSSHDFVDRSAGVD